MNVEALEWRWDAHDTLGWVVSMVETRCEFPKGVSALLHGI